MGLVWPKQSISRKRRILKKQPPHAPFSCRIQGGGLSVQLSTPQALNTGPPPALEANTEMASMFKLIQDMSTTMKTLATKSDLQGLIQKKYESIEKRSLNMT